MSHVNESCEWDMWMRQATTCNISEFRVVEINESCHTQKWLRLCHQYARVRSHIWMSPTTHIHVSRRTRFGGDSRQRFWNDSCVICIILQCHPWLIQPPHSNAYITILVEEIYWELTHLVGVFIEICKRVMRHMRYTAMKPLTHTTSQCHALLVEKLYSNLPPIGNFQSRF